MSQDNLTEEYKLFLLFLLIIYSLKIIENITLIVNEIL